MINFKIILEKVGEKPGRKKKFMTYVYGPKGNKSINSLEGANPTFDTCCKIAEFCGITLDQLRMPPVNDIPGGIANSGDNNNFGTITISNDAQRENAFLRQQLATQELLVKSKDETIQTLQELVEQLRVSKDETTSLYERHTK